MKYFPNERQLWIAESLRVFGFINRGVMRRKYGISAALAKSDLRAFLKANPGRMLYNAKLKVYFACNGKRGHLAKHAEEILHLWGDLTDERRKLDKVS